MAFTINCLRVVAADDAEFSDLVLALPDGADRCLCCRQPVGHRSPDSRAIVLIADESDDSPLTFCTAVCPMCAAVHPADQLLADWAERLAGHYGGRSGVGRVGTGRCAGLVLTALATPDLAGGASNYHCRIVCCAEPCSGLSW